MGDGNDSLNEAVAGSAERKLNQIVVAKENKGMRAATCWDLPQKILQESGAKTSSDYGDVTSMSEYIWGTLVDLSEVKRGDILQFSGYEESSITKIKGRIVYPDKKTVPFNEEEVSTLSRPHHSAIVASNNGNGRLVVFEQNVNNNPRTQQNEVHLSGMSPKPEQSQQTYLNLAIPSDVQKGYKLIGKVLFDKALKEYKNKGTLSIIEEKRTVEIKQKGTVKIYRPQPLM